MDHKRLNQFRIFYNQTLYPELLRLEKRRIRLVRLLILSGLLITAVIILELYLGIFLLTLLLSIPLALFVTYLGFRMNRFISTFKPQVMEMILDFIDDQPNLGDFSYEAKGGISKTTFLESKIFAGKPASYLAEDHIRGRVGELDFELCELFVKSLSPVRTRLDDLFKGIFVHAVFREDFRGKVVIWPRSQRSNLTRSIRQFTWEGAENVDHEIMNPEFSDLFVTYATGETHVAGMISELMQETIVAFHRNTGKEIYISFIDKQIYLAITEPKDILEPFIFRSNLSFELVRGYFEDIHLLISIVEDFDLMH